MSLNANFHKSFFDTKKLNQQPCETRLRQQCIPTTKNPKFVQLVHYALVFIHKPPSIFRSYRSKTCFFLCACYFSHFSLGRRLRRCVHRGQDALLLEQLSKGAVLVHAHENITTADEFLVEIELGDSGPVGELLDTCKLKNGPRVSCILN